MVGDLNYIAMVAEEGSQEENHSNAAVSARFAVKPELSLSREATQSPLLDVSDHGREVRVVEHCCHQVGVTSVMSGQSSGALVPEVVTWKVFCFQSWDWPACDFRFLPVMGDGGQQDIRGARLQPRRSPTAGTSATDRSVMASKQGVQVAKILLFGLMEQPGHEFPIRESNVVDACGLGSEAGRQVGSGDPASTP